jgi:hypothetical protein
VFVSPAGDLRFARAASMNAAAPTGLAWAPVPGCSTSSTPSYRIHAFDRDGRHALSFI